MSKGRRRRERVMLQGGPRAAAPPKRREKKPEGFPWPDWLHFPVAGAFAVGVVVAGLLVPLVSLLLIPLVVALALLPFTRWFTPAMAIGYCTGVLLLFALSPTELGPILGLIALGLLGVVSGHYLSTRVIAPLMARRQG